MRIAICDDQNNYINIIEDYIGKAMPDGVKFTCDAYYRGEELVSVYGNSEEMPYDLIFLDMEMDGLNGIETANEIRKYDKNVLIIYVTSYTSYVFECFDVNPLRFLVKPIDFEKFSEALNIAYSKFTSAEKILSFTVNRNLLTLYADDIAYFESNKRKMIIHTTKGQTYETYSTVNDTWKTVENSGFGLAHNSFIVNLRHVEFVGAETLKMADGTEIPISKKNRKEFLNAYMLYIERSYRL